MRYLVGLLLAITLWPQVPTESPTGRIEGSIVNSATRAPVRGVALTLMSFGQSPGALLNGNPPRPVTFSTTSDAEGHFAFASLPAGTYSIQAQRAGFLDSNLFNPLQVRAGRATPPETIEMTPQSVIVVTVQDDHGDVLEKANVVILSYRNEFGVRKLAVEKTGETNDNGEFRGSGLAAGTYMIAAGEGRQSYRRASEGSAVGLVPTFYPGQPTANQTSSIDIPAGGQRTVVVKLRRSMTYRIRGSMPVSTGKRMYINMVARNGADIGRLLPSASLDPNGTFDLIGVPPGSYELMATSLFEPDSPLAGRASVEVTDKPVDGVIIAPTTAVTLHGTVRFEDLSATRLPIGIMRIMALGLEGIHMGSGLPPALGADGGFTLRNLSRGKYIIQLAPVPPGMYLKAMRVGERDVVGLEIDLRSAAAETPIELVVGSKAAAVTITESRNAGSPAGYALIVHQTAGPGHAKGAVVPVPFGTNGRVAFPSLAPGEYLVYAVASFNPREGADGAALQRAESKAKRITVREGETAVVSVQQLQPGDFAVR